MGEEDKKHWLEPPAWWKKVKPLRWAAVLAIVAVAVSTFWTVKVIVAPSKHPETDKFLAVASDPVLFAAGFKSYDSLDTVRAQLDAIKVTYAVDEMHARPSSKYPPHDLDTLTADKFPHLGVEGQLTLRFFNNRLFQMSFTPSDPAAYVEKLHEADKRVKRSPASTSEELFGNLRVVNSVDNALTDVGKALQKAPTVIWEDTRLTAQRDDWDSRFVALPPEKKK